MDSGTTLISSIYERLRVDVIQGRWPPQAKLGIHALCKHYDCGATPVREALNRLAAEGWVRHADQRGFTVAGVSKPELEELTRTRIWLETLALRKSMERRSAEWEEAVVVALHRLSKLARSNTPERYEENPQWEALHRAFHLQLVSHCGSSWLVGYCEQLYDQAYRYRQLSVRTSYHKRDERGEHQAVVAAIVAGDADAACEALTAHYQATAQILLASD